MASRNFTSSGNRSRGAARPSNSWPRQRDQLAQRCAGKGARVNDALVGAVVANLPPLGVVVARPQRLAEARLKTASAPQVAFQKQAEAKGVERRQSKAGSREFFSDRQTIIAYVVFAKYYRKFAPAWELTRSCAPRSPLLMPFSRAQDDLFETSTMTFGQHLEELRRCLFKAILGLAIGCGIGLIPAVSVPVVDYIKWPVENALVDYYQQAAKTKALSAAQKEVFREAGYTSDDDLKRIAEIVEKQHASAEVVMIDPKHLLSQLQVQPDTKLPSPAGAASAADAGDLRKLVLFRPISDEPGIHMKTLNAQESFMIYLKASLLVGVVLASPWVFYQIWQFVAAGLYPHERRYVHLFLPMSLCSFWPARPLPTSWRSARCLRSC